MEREKERKREREKERKRDREKERKREVVVCHNCNIRDRKRCDFSCDKN
jgi:hypothetical protein